ncbi:MAG: elongation factor G [Planctomycetales bacterium]|nr:elongation factor G [Planctomycetales bacterium]
MSKAKLANLRNVAVCGHGGSGKTTLVDRLLLKTNAVSGHPSVDDGTSICDFEPEEKHHKHTVEAKLAHFEHGGCHFNIVDTPGYPDFIGQTIGALYGVETAAIVINAHSGIEVNSRRVFNEAAQANLGRVIVVNKMDTDNTDFAALVASFQELWGNACVPLTMPIGQGADFQGVINVLHPTGDTSGAVMPVAEMRERLIESIIEVDEEIMERYFEGDVPSDDELAQLMKRAVAAGTLIPILACSAKNDVGIAELLDFLPACTLAPDQVKRFGTLNGERIELVPDENAPLAARIFKTRVDPFVQKLSFIRVFSGSLHKDSQVHASTARKNIKLGPLLEVQAHDTHPVEEAGPGEIVAVAKIDELHTGTDLGDVVLRRMPFPTPMVGLAVTPKNRGDETKLSGALHKILEEDPTFHLDRDPQTKELVMTGMSELHLSIIQERLHRRDKLDVETKEPKIPYRETIQVEAEGSYRHKKQSGGRGQFGEVHIRMYPLPRGTDIDKFISKERFPSHKSHHYDEVNNFLWVDSVVGGSIPGNFMPAIEKGFKERLARGVIAGYQIQNLCVEVHFGKHHPVDSSEAAFKTAGSMVLRNVFQDAKPSLLEPVVKMAITVPEGNVGDVYSDMSGRRGRVLGSDAAGGNLQTVHAEAPLAEITTYARSLSSMTGGQGSYTMEFSHYDVVPGNVQQEILAKSKLEEEEEED